MKFRNVLKYIGLSDVLFFIAIVALVLEIQTSLALIEIEILMIRLTGRSICDPMVEVYMVILGIATTTALIISYIICKLKEIKKNQAMRSKKDE